MLQVKIEQNVRSDVMEIEFSRTNPVVLTDDVRFKFYCATVSSLTYIAVKMAVLWSGKAGKKIEGGSVILFKCVETLSWIESDCTVFLGEQVK